MDNLRTHKVAASPGSSAAASRQLVQSHAATSGTHDIVPAANRLEPALACAASEDREGMDAVEKESGHGRMPCASALVSSTPNGIETSRA
jgi:hypothetical protein